MRQLERALGDLIERSVGVVLDEHVERRLLPLAAERAAALGLPGGAGYVDLLAREPVDGTEWGRVIAALTNGQTSFFRDPEQLHAVASLLRGRGPAAPIRIWCAGCSTGEEPYSLAILAAELSLPARILATDVNPAFLEAARIGRFESWTLRNVSEERRRRWFEPAGASLAVKPEIRARVDFQRHNLVVDPPPGEAWDLILCRNVFLYFRRERVAEACRRLVAALARDGWLVVAASETLHDLGLPLAGEITGGRVAYRHGRPALVAAAPLPRRRAVTAPQWRPPVRPPEPTALERAAARAACGEVDEALRLLETLPDEHKGLDDWLALGHLRLKRHAFSPALDAYRRAGEIDPLLCEVHYFEGLVHRKTGDWRQAADALRRALFLAPTFWQASYLLAGAYERLDRADDAARERERTLRLLAEPGSTVAFLSHPVFVDWFAAPAGEVRRILRSDDGLR